jgi:putative FmdB family regulatory protein
MPIFEYACRDCGHHFEAFVTADRRPACPSCDGAELTKQLSSPGMVGAGESRSKAAAPRGGCGAGGTGCACRMG